MSFAAETNGGHVTSWIPLTSVFTPSPGCESKFRLNGPSLVVFDPGYGLDIDSAVKCAPSAMTTWWEQARLGFGGDDHTAMSIQPLTCPHLWTTVATYVKDKSSTQIMCCPSGYSNLRAASGSVNGDCVSSVSKGMVLTYASTAPGASKDWSTATTTLSALSSVGAIAIVGYNVERAVPTTRPDSSANLNTGSSNPPTSTSLESRPPPTVTTGVENSNDKAMSTGVKIGIGLGASLGLLGISALIIAIIMLHRRNSNKSGSPGAVEPVANLGVEDKGFGTSHHAPEAYDVYRHQIHSSPVACEMPSGKAYSPAELDTQGWSR